MKNQFDYFFHAESIAIIGASDEKGSVGYSLFDNIKSSQFDGRFYPVNIKHNTIQGQEAFGRVGEIEDDIDLALIATPARSVPQVLRECGEKGIRAAVIISAGFKEIGEEGDKLSEELLEIARTYKMRVIGPNCLGFITPRRHLNASFAQRLALPGKIAFISQSGALCTSILDWALKEGIGFSHFVSIGSMIDVGFHDLIDYFGQDPSTSSILIYMESLSNARRFMSAARAYARNKPIIVLKAGRSEAGAKAAMSHTGTLTGNDIVFDAAFKRAGILRVNTIGQLFNMAEVLARSPRPSGNRLAIITNAGGPGVLATDFLMENDGELASLSKETIDQLSEHLPDAWSHGNPVDILGDAGSQRYEKAIQLCLKDPNVDGVLVLLSPQAVTPAEEVAGTVVEVTERTGKIVLASWIGGQDVAAGVRILERGNVPVYAYPELAVESFLNMNKYARNLELLYETPATIPSGFKPNQQKVREIMQGVYKQNRTSLQEYEAKQVLKSYDIPISQNGIARNKDEIAELREQIPFPWAMKILSPDILHKTDIQGVELNVQSLDEANRFFQEVMERARSTYPEADIEGVLIEEMANKKYELLIGAKKDAIFGPAIVFGLGGVAVEVFKDLNVGLPPLNMALAERLIEDTKIYTLLKGYRGMPGVDIESIQFLLYKFAYLLIDFPEIKEIDINPFAVDKNGGVVLDAKVVLDKKVLEQPVEPYSHLVISPYPRHYVTEFTMKNGQNAILRPIRPEDEPMEAAMFKTFSERTQYFRFFRVIKQITHEMLVRFTHNDYDREIAIVAEVEEDGEKKMAGVVRLVSDALNNSAEFAIVVADPWHGLGLGNKFTDYILEIARDRGIKKVYATLLKSNNIMLHMFRKRGFSITDEGGSGTYYAEKIVTPASSTDS